MGDLRARGAVSATATSSRCDRATATSCSRSIPTAFAFEVPPLSASIVTRLRVHSGRTPSGCASASRPTAGSPGRWRSTRCISDRGRGCPRKVDRYLTYRELGRAADPVRQGDGLHAHRAAAGDGASVLRLVGLSGHRVLRADQPVRLAGRFPGLRRRVPPPRHRRDSRLGAGALSRRTRTRWRGSTAPRSTSTPIRGRASTATGAR